MKPRLTAIMLLVIGLLVDLPMGLAKVVEPSGEVSLPELRQRLEFYSKIKSFKVDFDQDKFIKSMDVHLKSKGSLEVRKSSSVIWKITHPSPITVKIDDKNLEMTSGLGKGAQTQKLDLANTPSAMKNLTHLTNWLKLDPVELTANYNIRKKSELVYLFTPKEESTLFDSLQMELEKNGHLKTLTLQEKSQDTLEISFGKPRPIK